MINLKLLRWRHAWRSFLAGDVDPVEYPGKLGTIAAERIPVKIILLNNGYLGMVRQWQEIFYDGRYKEVDMRPGMPDFVKLSEAYGIRGIRVDRLGDLDAVIAEARAYDGPLFLDCRVEAEENVYPIVPPAGRMRMRC